MYSALRRGALLLAGSCLGLAGCDEPRPLCSVAQGDFAAVYTLVEGTGECATLVGETLGVQAYYARTSAHNPRPDYKQASIAIQPQSITAMLGATAGCIEPNPEDAQYAFGAFASAKPGADDFCVVPTLSTSRLRLPALTEPSAACMCTPAQPELDVSYEWSNVRVYVTAGAYGSQLSADLRYTKDGCTALYRVRAVYPAVSCAMPVEVPDAGLPEEDASLPEEDAGDDQDSGGADMDAGLGEDGATADLSDGSSAEEDAASSDAGADEDAEQLGSDAESPAPGEEDASCPPPEPPGPPEPAPLPDDSVCQLIPDPGRGVLFGSGINSTFAVTCDPTLLLCVPSKEPPSLR